MARHARKAVPDTTPSRQATQADAGTAGTERGGAEKDAARPRRDKGTKGRSALIGGFSALRKVRKANKDLGAAQTELRQLRQMLQDDRDLLAHREQVERDYPQILSAQNAEIKTASAASARSAERAASLTEERGRLLADLERMKADHERELRPFRNLMDSSRSRADDSARKLADAKRVLKGAESRVADETKRRDQRLKTANRDVDSAQERLRKLEAEISALEGDAQAVPGAIEKVKAERELELSHIETAKGDVARISAECAEAVDAAQRELVSRQVLTEEAEREVSSTKQEATARKEEYERLFKQASAEEKQLEDQAKAREDAAKEATKAKEAADRRVEAARQILGEANEIHGNPATTQGLRERIANEKRDADAKQAEVDALKRTAAELKRRTRASRAVFVLACVVLLAVAIVALWYFTQRR